MPAPSGKVVFWINFSIALIILLLGTGIMIGTYHKPDDFINWKMFSVFLLVGIYWNFFMYGTWIGVVNIINENELKKIKEQ